jgi:hypothetical protein
MLRTTMAAVFVVLLASATPSLAQYSGPAYHGDNARAQASGGTPQEEAACRRDTRKFCRHVKAGAGNDAFLQCLQAHRAKLSRACDAVLRSHGM